MVRAPKQRDGIFLFSSKSRLFVMAQSTCVQRSARSVLGIGQLTAPDKLFMMLQPWRQSTAAGVVRAPCGIAVSSTHARYAAERNGVGTALAEAVAGVTMHGRRPGPRILVRLLCRPDPLQHAQIWVGVVKREPARQDVTWCSADRHGTSMMLRGAEPRRKTRAHSARALADGSFQRTSIVDAATSSSAETRAVLALASRNPGGPHVLRVPHHWPVRFGQPVRHVGTGRVCGCGECEGLFQSLLASPVATIPNPAHEGILSVLSD